MLLRGGLVADGIGATTVPAGVLTDGPVIASIGAGDPPAGCEVIDLAPGSVVCPGFIDAHAHAEGPLLATGRVDGALAQGDAKAPAASREEQTAQPERAARHRQ